MSNKINDLPKLAPLATSAEITMRDPSDLHAHEKNARTHSDEQIAQIAASIEEWGWTMPLLVDEVGKIIAGHGRLAAAKLLGLGEVPTIVASGWSSAQKRAYLLADNKLALNAGWDTDLLKGQLEQLKFDEFDVSLIGFSDEELNQLFEDASGSEPSGEGEGGSSLPEGYSYQVVAVCDSEADQGALLLRLEQEGYQCRPLIL